jgi:hypothetical protein
MGCINFKVEKEIKKGKKNGLRGLNTIGPPPIYADSTSFIK